MARLLLSGLVLGLVVVCRAKPVEDDVTAVDLLMPDVQPTTPDTYLCFPMKMNEATTYITGFDPHANMAIAHHILLYGCDEPSHKQGTWDCGEMMHKAGSLGSAPPCAGVPRTIYAWAMDAPALKLPEGVGFKVGGKTSVQWLVLQVHYKDVSHFLPPENLKDYSGITLHTTTVPQPRRAGVYLLSTGGELQPNSTTYMEAACSLDEPMTIHPFAFRTHTHIHGEVVSGYRVRDGEWTEIGQKSPQKPQMFYDVTTPGIVVKQGDILAARCTMRNDEDRIVKAGPTQQDEMCNFYIMYWMDGDHTLKEIYCTTEGPPNWYWNKMSTIHVENIPANASIIPGTDKPLKETAHMAAKVFDHVRHEFDNDIMDMLATIEGETDPDEERRLEDFMNEIPDENEFPGYRKYDPDLYNRMSYGRGYGLEDEEDFDREMREWEQLPQQQHHEYRDMEDEMQQYPRY